jgi:hypothetical protein
MIKLLFRYKNYLVRKADCFIAISLEYANNLSIMALMTKKILYNERVNIKNSRLHLQTLNPARHRYLFKDEIMLYIQEGW